MSGKANTQNQSQGEKIRREVRNNAQKGSDQNGPKRVVRPLQDKFRSKSVIRIKKQESENSSNPNDKKDESVVSGETRNFTKEEFDAAWEETTVEFLNDGKKSLASMLKRRDPEVDIDNATVHIKLDHKAAKLEFDGYRSDLLGKLKSKLRNDNIQLSFDILKQKDDADKGQTFTNSDKFNKLADKNPALKTLRKKLGLDYDF